MRSLRYLVRVRQEGKLVLETLTGNLDVYLKGSMLLAFAAAYLGGVLVSFTPCMYPLIPITVSYIGAQGKVSKATGFFLSLLYVLGTSVTYTVLGSVAGITGSLFGGLQTNPWVNLIVANVFILMGLAMLDVFFLPLPDILRSELF